MKRLWMFKVNKCNIVMSWQAMQIITDNWKEHNVKPIGQCCMLNDHELCMYRNTKQCKYKCRQMKDEEGRKWNVIKTEDYVKHIFKIAHEIRHKKKPG